MKSLLDRRTFSAVAALFFAVGVTHGEPIDVSTIEGRVRVACVGDSITYGAGVQDRQKNCYPAQLGKLLGEKWDVRNFGHSARTMLKNVQPSYWNSPQFKAAKDFKPHVVIIKLGTNDVKPQYRKTLDAEFAKDYEAMIDVFAEMKAKVYICYPVPVIGKGNFGITNSPVVDVVIPTLEKLSKKKNIPIIDLYAALKPFPQYLPDKIHPNAAGAAVMARAVHAALTATTASANAKDGFRPMFNGKDLTGWQTTGNWIVEKDGVITLHPRPGEKGWQRYSAYLTTTRKYSNFMLDLEFKFQPKGNSGVFLRVGDPKSQVKSGFEVQILDTHGKKNPTAHDCGGVIGTMRPSKNMVKPAGEWNRYQITVNGNQLKVVLNGEQVIDLDISKSAIKDRPKSGYIGFQDEAKVVSYRNVRIKELP